MYLYATHHVHNALSHIMRMEKNYWTGVALSESRADPDRQTHTCTGKITRAHSQRKKGTHTYIQSERARERERGREQ